MSKTIICDRCTKEITLKDDLVTVTMFFEVIPYHEECYAHDLKGTISFFLNNRSLNGLSGNISMVISILFGLWLVFFTEGSLRFVSLLVLIPIIYRLYSYLAYERHLEA
ncbi:hypothetical protein LCY76_06735 [Fictibacillus sp. KIGAM418]|uniref:Permease n=1 Tax=Fictibacillus marinisediminis TaxID=2878389 RepID=A0A9X1XC29_9BACL|nr:hypothetical protein [Fictibacillus marinisediminis]MCK6256290.1 hypothetical protein [Fictibacillus marinisediminis]